MNRKSLITIFTAAFTMVSAWGQLRVETDGFPAIKCAPEGSSTGLESIWVIYQTAGTRLVFRAQSATSVATWSRFGAAGGGYAETVPSHREGMESWVEPGSDDCGYIIDCDGRRYCYWIINYQNHQCQLHSLNIGPEQDCVTTTLLCDGAADKMTYYSINGAPKILSRELRLTYSTLEYSEEQQQYVSTLAQETLDYASAEIHVTAPLCDTDFSLTGDRFLEQWGIPQSVTSPLYATNAVSAQTTATQTPRDNDNEQNVEATYGGSAPVEITFSAAVTDAAVYREWQLAKDPEFEMIDLRINELEFVHTFRDYGTFYVRFVCDNAGGTCQAESETYEVYIGESQLRIPNAFSPNDDGTNDLWKVSYKSLVSFDCHIFNRWGLEMAHLTDPSQGWDGRYNGKKVPSGAYFYVIQARGADGKKYNKSGDINIIGSRPSDRTTTGQ